MSSSPSLLVSRASKEASRRAGTSRNCRFGSPQFCRKSFTDLSDDTLCTISVFVSVPELSLSIIRKHSRAALRNSAVKASISARFALCACSRSTRRCSSFAFKAVSMAASHSMASISPDRSVSSASRAASKRAGTNKYWRFGLPQSLRNVITSLSFATCVLSISELPQNRESRRVEGTFTTDADHGRHPQSPSS